MPEVLPLEILHIQLEEVLHKVFPLTTEQNGYYLVFWWKHIPLGDLYIDAGESVETEKLKTKILTAITPAIDFYVERLGLTPAIIKIS